jgi:hypothetical protein
MIRSEAEPPTVREFLYVDVQRARSLLAQLEDGVVEQHIRRSVVDDVAELGASIMGLGGKGRWSTEQATEESRSLQDLTFATFEGAATAQGLITELVLSPEVEDWSSGVIHGHLREGEIVRATGDLLVVDPTFIRSRFESFDEFIEAVVAVQMNELIEAVRSEHASEFEQLDKKLKQAPLKGRKQIEKQIQRLETETRSAAEAAAKAQFGGSDQFEQLRSIMKLVTTFLGESIAVRLLPCGFDQPELGFAGSLLARDDYLQRERDALFSRYGSVLREWTVVMQIAHLPDRTATASALKFDPSALPLVQGEQINRAQFERAAAELLRMMEATGLAEGPRWPTISIVPLAIYRKHPSPRINEEC